jgi:hypothetical protein
VRFYACHRHEIGLITSSPQHILAPHTDWRVFEALKQALKREGRPPALHLTRLTKNDEGPTSLTLVGNTAGSPQVSGSEPSRRWCGWPAGLGQAEDVARSPC